VTEAIDRSRSQSVVVPGTPPSKSRFPGPVVIRKEDKEAREGRKRGEPSVQVWSLVYEL
jgi:hypothetical protein